MARRMLGGLTLKELAVRIWREANEDNAFGTAAELAYYFMLALFPMLIFLTSLVGFLPGVQEHIFYNLAEVMPGQAMKLVQETLNDVVSKRSGGLLSFRILGTLWAASSGVAALMGTLPIALGWGAGAEARRPLGLAVVGGLLVSQTLTLYVTPVFYIYMDMLQDRLGRRKKAAQPAIRALEPQESAK